MPKPIEIYDNPGAYWHLITTAKDVDFEDQHFDRKEAGRPDPVGNFSSNKLSEIIAHVKETISAFANTNRDGGLLVVGVSKNGEVTVGGGATGSTRTVPSLPGKLSILDAATNTASHCGTPTSVHASSNRAGTARSRSAFTG